jgi:RND family efflux transporter MFP subunit
LNLSEISARYNNARNALQKAERDLERVSSLYRDRAATLEQFQNAGTAEEVARSNMEIARFNLDHSVIRAPYKGKILKRLAEVNEVIGPGHPVFLFGSTENQWVVRTGVPERDAVRLELEDPGEVRFDAYPGQIFQAEVSEISQAVDPASGTIEVELEIRSRNIRLMSGFVALVDVFPEKKDRCLLIPVDALVDSEGLRGYVFVPDGNKARKIEVRIMHLFPDRVAVVPDSVIPGRVITTGSGYLSDGMSIKIVQ